MPDIAATSGLRTDERGRLLTDETLTSVDDPRVVATGDCASQSGVPLRMSCQMAEMTRRYPNAQAALATDATAAAHDARAVYAARLRAPARSSLRTVTLMPRAVMRANIERTWASMRRLAASRTVTSSRASGPASRTSSASVWAR